MQAVAESKGLLPSSDDYFHFLENQKGNYESKVSRELKILEYFSYEMIPVLFQSSQLANVKFQNLKEILEILKLNYNSEKSLEITKEELDFMKRITLNFLKEIVKRFKSKVSLHFAKEILGIINILLEKYTLGNNLIASKEILDLLKICLENVSSFGDLEFKSILEILKTNWNFKESLIGKSKIMTQKKEQTKSMELKSYYDGLKEFLETRTEIVTVLNQMIKYDSSLNDNHDLIVFMLHDLLYMRIIHNEQEYEEYHVKLLQAGTELLICNYPKHIFPLVYHCLHKAYYSPHLEIKDASIHGLRMCSLLVNRQSIIPLSFNIPIMRDPSQFEVELEISDGSIHKMVEQEYTENHDGNLFEEESLFHKPAYRPESVKEAMQPIQDPNPSLVPEKEDGQESNYISLSVSEDSCVNQDKLSPPKTLDHPKVEGNESVISTDKEAAIFIDDRVNEISQNQNDALEDNQSDDGDSSAAFSIPEINIDTSDED